MNDILSDLLDHCMVAYILIYLDTIEQHQEHVREVLWQLRKHSLFAKVSKYDSPSSVHSVVQTKVPAYHVQATDSQCHTCTFGSVRYHSLSYSFHFTFLHPCFVSLRYTSVHIRACMPAHHISPYSSYILTVWFPFIVYMSWLIV